MVPVTPLCLAMSHATPRTFCHQRPLQQRVSPDSFTPSLLAAFLPGNSLKPYSGGHSTETLQGEKATGVGDLGLFTEMGCSLWFWLPGCVSVCFFFSKPGSWRAVIVEALLPLMGTSVGQLLALQHVSRSST